MLGGLPGDVFSRFMWQNCSVDKLWVSMLCPIPPLSLVPAIMYFLGYIEKGIDSCSSSVDMYILILPIVIFIMSLLFNNLIQNAMLSYLLFIGASFMIFVLFRYLKYSDICTNVKNKNTNNQIKSAFLNSFIVFFAIVMIDFVAPYAQSLPLIGLPFRVWEMGNNIMITKPLFLTALHFILNLYANLPDIRANIC